MKSELAIDALRHKVTSMTGAVRVALSVDALGNCPHCIDVEARVGFVEHGKARFQTSHLQNF